MKKFCFCFPLVESGIVVGVYGAIVWLLYFIHALIGRNMNCKSSDKRKLGNNSKCFQPTLCYSRLMQR